MITVTGIYIYMEKTLEPVYDRYIGECTEEDMKLKMDMDVLISECSKMLNSVEYAMNRLDKDPNVHYESVKSDDDVSKFIKFRDQNMSKSGKKKEIKRLQKVIRNAERAKKSVKKVNVDSMTEEEYRDFRVQRFDSMGIEMYPHKVADNIDLCSFIKRYNHLDNDECEKGEKMSLSGSVVYCRSSSKKLYFYMIEADGYKLQVMASLSTYEGDPKTFKDKCDLVGRGDHINIKGYPYRSKTGELSIVAQHITFLAPCLVQLPKPIKDEEGNELSNFTNVNTRYRERYKDFKINFTSRQTLLTRAKIVSTLRNYLEDMNFIEIETPVLSAKASGAAATPFESKCSALDNMSVFMRIAPELYLKRMLVGGFSRVYEIGKQFRNESMDPTHNPEFTSCEFYMKGADYDDLMKMTEDIVVTIVQKVNKNQKSSSMTTKYTLHDQSVNVDWTPPFARIDIMEEMPKQIISRGVEFDWPDDLFTDEANLYLKTKVKELGIECEEPQTTTRLLDKMIEELLECMCKNPTFLYNQPQVMSPLAKPHRSVKHASERFELFVLHKELCNAFTELNDPRTQLRAFEEQMKDREKGDTEATEPDYDYINALRVGLPPCAGWGLGIDRLTMFLTENVTIKEVIAFPMMKPE